MRLIEKDPSRCREEWEERKARRQVLKAWGVCDQHEQAAEFLACWRGSFWQHPFESLVDLPLVIFSFIRLVIFKHVLTHIDDDLVND